MTEGDVVLASVQQADGAMKNRPGLVLREIRPFGDLLICAISTSPERHRRLLERLSNFLVS